MGSLGTGDGVNVVYFAHLGGAIAAYIYMRMATSSGMDQVRQRVANLPDADEPPRAIPRSMPRRERGDEVDDIVAKSKAIAAKRMTSLTPTSRRREARAEELNRVLDKISQHGIESLTSDERKVLEEMSRRLARSSEAIIFPSGGASATPDSHILDRLALCAGHRRRENGVAALPPGTVRGALFSARTASRGAACGGRDGSCASRATQMRSPDEPAIERWSFASSHQYL